MTARPLLVRLAHGSITKAETTAIVVSHFEGLAPAGAGAAVGAVDRILRGAISRFMEYGMLRGKLGEFFPIPTPTGELSAQVTVVMGLGEYDVFHKKMTDKKGKDPELMRKVARRLVEGMLQINAASFATTLFGAGGGGLSSDEAAFDFVNSFCEALETLDKDRRIHEVTLVEIDPAKLPAIRRGVERVRQGLAETFQMELRETRIPPVEAVLPSFKPVMYLRVRIEEDVLKYSIQTDHPVEVMVPRRINPQAVNQAVQRVLAYGRREGAAEFTGPPDRIEEALRSRGRDLRVELIPDDIMELVRNLTGAFNMILSLDKRLASIPWELIYDDTAQRFLCQLPLGRQVQEAYSSFRRGYRDARDDEINMLIIANPTGDLAQAEAEARALKQLIDDQIPQVKADLWERTQIPADRSAGADIIGRLNTGIYEIVHYSGHAEFDEVDPMRSGWIVNWDPREKIEAFRFENTPRAPVLAFHNACQSAAVPTGVRRGPEVTYGLAEGFLKAGVNLYLGSIWDIDDRAARTFAQALYQMMVIERKDLGEAMVAARAQVLTEFGLGEPTWASYVLYGSPSFRF